MYKSKRYGYAYEDYADDGKNAETLVQEIVADKEFQDIDELVIGCWGEAWDESPQPLVDYIAEHPQQFSHIKSMFIGDMDFEECEVSWIIQADYSKLWAAMPQLQQITIKGSTDLTLGLTEHENLKSLEIICGGLPKEVIGEIEKAKLPGLERLMLYLGVEDYGFDGDIGTVNSLLENSDFPKLTYLGLTDSEIQDDVTEAVLKSKYMDQLSNLALGMGSLTDKGGQMLLDALQKYTAITNVDLDFHYMTDGMVKKLEQLEEERAGLTISMDDQQEPDVYDGETYYYPMLTE